MADLLTAFPLHRQAAIVRRLVCRPAWERGDVPGIGRYRSAENIRVVIAAGGTKPYPPRFTVDPGELPGASKKASRQRLCDILPEYSGPVCGLRPPLWAIDRSRSCLGIDPWLDMSRSQSDGRMMPALKLAERAVARSERMSLAGSERIDARGG